MKCATPAFLMRPALLSCLGVFLVTDAVWLLTDGGRRFFEVTGRARCQSEGSVIVAMGAFDASAAPVSAIRVSRPSRWATICVSIFIASMTAMT